ncbi:MAG: N-6 DNA methylase [Sulfurimonas sp.]|nr:N-6 DNA methylase [Sulfurimonas sp.]PHQ92531.1 MAG: DNA methylase [Sulfurimonas sp.]
MKISEILKDTNYKLTQFKSQHIQEIESLIFEKELRGKSTNFIKCLVRQKDIQVKPEELVRQLFLLSLHKDYDYPYSRMQIEYAVHFGREVKRADIVIMDKVQPTVPYIVIEVKKPKLKDGKEQLKSYCNSTGATIAIWSNGEQTLYYHRKDPNYFEPIPNIPIASKSLKDVLKEEFNIQDLIKKDILKTQRRSLKSIVLDMEDEVLANAGVDVFEEVFKLIFIKLFDELQNTRGLTKNLEFRNYGESDGELKEKIEDIFLQARRYWSGIFKDDETIELTASHLSVCVSSLQDVKLFNSNLDVIDDAFEYLVNKNAKGEKGQYFTPRYVIDMCVKIMNPQEDEYMMDTASGSCGFPIHTVFEVWKKIYKRLGLPPSDLLTAEEKHPIALAYVKEKVFGIDFDKKTVRVARMLNIIAGDGHTNVLNMNSLDFERWDENTKDEDWQDTYFEGWKRLKKLRTVKNENKEFEFDMVMANPPFAGDIKESRILHRYELGKKPNGKYQTKVGRDILFIERNLDMLKSGGRMAVVLPQGRFNNSSDKNIRDFIADKCRILAVVGLHGNVFKPHTGTKTSVLIIQKWDDELCPKKDDYNIFFATMESPSKDNSGEKIYVKNEDGTNKLDEHDHLIVEHDLFNHEGLTQDGIAEAFSEFAKKENLSFSGKSQSPFNEAKYNALLDGLEAVELKLSEVLEDNVTFRFDSEYFQKRYLKLFCNLINFNLKEVQKIAQVSDGDHSRFPDRQLQEVGYLQAKDLKNDFVSSNNIYVSKEYFEKQKRSHIFEENILISIMGNVGDIAITPKGFIPCIANRAVSIIKNIVGINPYFMFIFLKTNLLSLQIERLKNGGVQERINLEVLSKLKIPILGLTFQIEIENIVKLSHQKSEDSKTLYKKSEELLLKELDLLDFELSKEKIAIKTFKQSFGDSGRLDSEYYQPKYDEIVQKISDNSSVTFIKDEFIHIKTKFDKSKDGYNYTEIGNVNVSDGTNIFNYVLTEDLPANAKINVTDGDLLISTVRPSRGAITIIHTDETDLIVSGAFTVLRKKENSKINTQVLQVLLRTNIYKKLLLKYNVGTQYPVIKDEDVLNLIIPIIGDTIQIQIESKIKESFKLKEESKKLLEVAKKAVEIAIEENESIALLYIENITKKEK